jgi:hypothetical protein
MRTDKREDGTTDEASSAAAVATLLLALLPAVTLPAGLGLVTSAAPVPGSSSSSKRMAAEPTRGPRPEVLLGDRSPSAPSSSSPAAPSGSGDAALGNTATLIFLVRDLAVKLLMLVTAKGCMETRSPLVCMNSCNWSVNPTMSVPWSSLEAGKITMSSFLLVPPSPRLKWSIFGSGGGALTAPEEMLLSSMLPV